MARKFTPPWKVERIPGGFKVVDAEVAYVYGVADDPTIGKTLTLDEARRIASSIAKLPVLLRQARPDDSLQAESNRSDERHQAEDTTPNDDRARKHRKSPE